MFPNQNDVGAERYNVRHLFGFDSTSGIRPPDLIIQDELHLLTGPLGTISGIVETAMDTIWQSIGHKPKYVAATATIRGADKDAMLMYGKLLNVFPPPISSADDNFFAKLDHNPKTVESTLVWDPYTSRLLCLHSLLHR